MMSTVRFDAALEKALDRLLPAMSWLAPEKERVVLLRDVYGCFQILVEDLHPEAEATGFTEEELQKFSTEFGAAVGNYLPNPKRLFAWIEAAHPLYTCFNAPERWQPIEREAFPRNLFLLDRQVTGREWLLDPIPQTQTENAPERAVFFGIKGGVGRSTALSLLAWDLSRRGKKVLVVDLDLESPGLGSILLPGGFPQANDTTMPGWPSFGVTDWFVEQAIGQADDYLIQEMASRSPLATVGEIWVVPAAGGLLQQDYLGKLSRVYLDLRDPQTGELALFGDRLARMLAQLEAYYLPDVVLLDCRAGLHDISSVVLTRLNAYNFLFAIDTAQTWAAYRHLFQHWQHHPKQLRALRERLVSVAAMMPKNSNKDEYIKQYCESASDTFAEIYDAVDPEKATADGELLFNFAPNDEDAPHYPCLIRSHENFAAFAPQQNASTQLDEELVRFVFGSFLEKAKDILGVA